MNFVASILNYQRVIAYILLFLILPFGCAIKTETAQEFLEHTYKQYTGIMPQTLRSDDPNLFSSQLLSLIKEEQIKSQEELGFLDFDPICFCQDVQDLKVLKLQITELGIDKAKAHVKFTNAGQYVEIDFDLVLESGRWLINDIRTTELPSLKNFLEDGLK